MSTEPMKVDAHHHVWDLSVRDQPWTAELPPRAPRRHPPPGPGGAGPDWLLRAEVRRGLSAVAEAGLVYDLLVLAHQLPAAVKVVDMVPGLRWVLDHAGKPPIAAGLLDPWRDNHRARPQRRRGLQASGPGRRSHPPRAGP